MPQAPPDEIRVKCAFNNEVFITYIKPDITYDRLQEEVKEMCKFSTDQVFTVKWVDEEGDPCLISTQMELEEAIRLYEVNHEPELVIHGWKRYRFDSPGCHSGHTFTPNVIINILSS
ncbi:hypothetical protein M8J76_012688 [Diaphorina citri]|nr:hypothetical protein M8J76_012688 [Diaphorina citri]